VIISIVNHKGGTGKTTTTINLGSALALLGCKVLLIDFDAQGSLSYSLGIGDAEPTIAEVLHREKRLEEVIQERESMSVLPGGTALADIELAIAQSENRFDHLKNLLTLLPAYDFILIDCPPSLSLLTLNALTASTHVLVPMQLDVLALRGLDSMLETMRKVDSINPRLSLLGVLPIMIDPRKNIHQEILSHIKTNYNVHIFSHPIRASVKAAEAPSFGKSVVHYAPASTTTSDYQELAKEIHKRYKGEVKKLQATN
jgi:chromosome partitioning protein